MSGSSLTPTVAATPSAVQSATALLAQMAALSGTATDYNIGSQIRTAAESVGAISEQEGIGTQALALQAFEYGALSLFGISQPQAQSALVPIIFATSLPVSAAPVVPQPVPIPSGTIVSTPGGTQFITYAASVLASGTSSVTVPGIATTAGSAGNIPASGISGTPLTPVGWPLVVTNAVAASGGTDQGTQSLAQAQFAGKAASLGLSSPVAISNAVDGYSVSGETVAFSQVFEPWIAAGSGAGSGTAGFTLYIDNGSGGASATLIAAVKAFILGNAVTNQSGYRPAGMPFTVSGVTPVYATVAVSGLLIPGILSSGSVYNAVVSGVTNYFSGVGISTVVPTGSIAAYQPQIAAAASDAGLGGWQSLTVTLCYSGSSTAVPVVSGGTGTRVILGALTVNVG